MKNLKTILIPVGLIAIVAAIFSFSTYPGNGDKKCKVKIIKIVDGVKTVTDSTFDCDEAMDFQAEINGDSLHKMIKMMMTDGDSGEFNFDFNFDIDESDENGMKMMKFKGGDGEEFEMKFDCNMEKGEGGSMKMMINGEKLEIKLGEMHKHLEKLHEHLDIFDDENGNIEITIDSDEDGEKSHSVKIIKSIDDDGKVTMKKIINGEEIEIDDKEIHKLSKGHKMMFIGDDGKIDGNHEVTIDVQMDGEEKKHMVIITKITSENKEEIAKKNPAVKSKLNKKELSIDKLKFSPNPNNGKFDLSFKLDKKRPVQIKIFDVQGKEVYNEKVTDFDGEYSNKIDISENGEGIYLLQITQGGKASISKILIK
jgi:hypothetical protein